MPKKLTKKVQDKFRKDLRSYENEKDIEDAYRTLVSAGFESEGGYWSSKHDTDGFFTNGMFLNLLLETKVEKNYALKKVKCETLAQALYYIKRFEQAGEVLPNVVLVGDLNECFVVAGSALYRYLKEDLDWTIAPSEAAAKNTNLIVKMINDKGISPFVFNVADPSNDMNDVLALIDQLALSGETQQVPVTEHNMRVVYDSFLRCLFPKNTKLSSDQLVSIFVQSMTDPDNCYLHPNKPNILVMRNGDNIPITGLDYYAFFSRYDRSYSANEIAKITEIADRLIVETERRFSGDYWTPSIWADRAHEMLDEALGSDWRDEFVVWDCACGTKNLTRDYSFKKLYLSTLHQSELDMSADYNSKAQAFQFDFLNDDVNTTPLTDPRLLTKMPVELFEDLCARKPILFLINPPYGTANDKHSDEYHKAGIAKTAMNELMKKEKAGKASQQLFTQFLWRIMKLKRDFLLPRVVVGVFMVPSIFNPTEYWTKFNSQFFSEFGFVGGNLFTAGEFSNVKSKWAVTFSILDSEAAGNGAENEAKMSVESFDPKIGEIRKIGTKSMRNVPAEDSMSEWVKDLVSERGNIKDPKPLLASGLKPSNSKSLKSIKQGSLGYMVAVANDVGHADRDTWICSGPIGIGHGFSICEENFAESLVMFASRKLCTWGWMNEKDQFEKPDISADGYEEFETDCMVYSIFHKDCQPASADAFEYEGETFELKNSWFPWSRELMMSLADETPHYCLPMYNEAKADNERLMYVELQRRKRKHLVSDEAQEVLNRGEAVLRKTFEMRVAIAASVPELFLMRWDAGWYQLKRMYTEDEFKEISSGVREALKRLGEKIKPKIYEYGILPKDDFSNGLPTDVAGSCEN